MFRMNLLYSACMRVFVRLSVCVCITLVSTLLFLINLTEGREETEIRKN